MYLTHRMRNTGTDRKAHEEVGTLQDAGGDLVRAASSHRDWSYIFLGAERMGQAARMCPRAEGPPGILSTS